MPAHICPICGESEFRQHVEVRPLAENSKVTYSFQHSVCASCESDLVTPQQHEANLRAIVKAKCNQVGAPESTAIREWRRRWGLTQAEAGTLTGVGPVAFCKYETGTLSPSAPTASLLIVLLASDDAVRKLALARNVKLKEASRADRPHSYLSNLNANARRPGPKMVRIPMGPGATPSCNKSTYTTFVIRPPAVHGRSLDLGR